MLVKVGKCWVKIGENGQVFICKATIRTHLLLLPFTGMYKELIYTLPLLASPPTAVQA
jgi:hypothetical protein